MGVTQLYTFLGLPNYEGVHSTYEKFVHLFVSIQMIHLPSALIGLLSLFLFIGLQRFDRRIPSGFVGLFIISLAVSIESGLFHSDGQAYHVALVGDAALLNSFVPTVEIPYFNWTLINSMIPFAFAVSLLGVLESTSIAKSISVATGQRLSLNQEILGLGIGNIVSSLLGAMPISGSPSRSALNYLMGAQTRFSSLFSALFVAVFLFAFQPLISEVPLTALSALLLLTVPKMINRKQLALCVNATSSDAFVTWATLLSCLIFSLEVAFYIGVGISITLYLKKAATPLLSECYIDDAGGIHVMERCDKGKSRKVRLIKVEGELFFGAADIFHSTLRSFSLADSLTKVIILELRNARDMDATACLALQQLHNYLSRSGRHLLICGITPSVWKVFTDAGVVSEVGRENLFPCSETDSHEDIVRARERAEELLQQNDDIAKMLIPSYSREEALSLEHAQQ
jgi:SulP family sulfate permease